MSDYRQTSCWPLFTLKSTIDRIQVTGTNPACSRDKLHYRVDSESYTLTTMNYCLTFNAAFQDFVNADR